MRYGDLHRLLRDGAATPAVPRWAQGVLAAVGAGELEVRAVRHPLGFLCLPVERSGRYGVCLHLWSPELSRALTTTAVHCHSWDLISYLLYGRIRNVLARFGDGREYQVLEVISRGETDELRATARTVRAKAGEETSHGPGEVYTLPAGVFHTTLVADGREAATVVLGMESPAGRDLSLGALDLRSHQVRRLHCEPPETRRLARRAAALLTAEVSS